MKKYVILILACVMILCLMGCGTKDTGTSNPTGPVDLAPSENGQDTDGEEEQSSFLAKVISADGYMLLVEPLYGERELRSADRIYVGIQDILSEEEISSLNEGDIVQIIYDGYLLESYPAQIQKEYDVIKKELSEVFAICYSNWIVLDNKNIYDTIGGYIQKDLVTEGIAAIDYIPDNETLSSVLNQISELDLLSIDREMTSIVLTDTDEAVGVEPCTHYEIIIQLGGMEYTIKGDSTAWHYKDTDSQAKSFTEFISFMNELMQNTVEYKSLPEAVGGYE